MVKTREVTDRRELHFSAMSDLVADIDALDAAAAVTATGNWTAGQVVEHVTLLIDGSLDGLPFKAPFIVRLVGRLIKKRVLHNPLKPGLKLPSNMTFLVPDPDVGWENAVAHLHRSVARTEHERMTQPSPAFGPMTHEEWIKLHCRHAEMHFSFLKNA